MDPGGGLVSFADDRAQQAAIRTCATVNCSRSAVAAVSSLAPTWIRIVGAVNMLMPGGVGSGLEPLAGLAWAAGGQIENAGPRGVLRRARSSRPAAIATFPHPRPSASVVAGRGRSRRRDP